MLAGPSQVRRTAKAFLRNTSILVLDEAVKSIDPESEQGIPETLQIYTGRSVFFLCVLPGFVHFPGVHCGSTALSDAMRYYDYDLSEAMCFGLGAGLGGVFWHDDRYLIKVGFNGRSLYLEPQFFASVNVKFRWRTGEFQWTEMRRALTHGFPVLALANIVHFEHANTAVDFASHTVLLVGFDETSNTVLVADTHYPGLQDVKLSSLARAMNTKAFPPLFSGNAWKEVGRVSMPSIEVAIRAALKTNINLMLRPHMEQMGLSAIRKLALSLPTWDQFPRCWNVPLCFYDFAEKRGSGGGAFRYLYAQFLDEASRYLPCLLDIEAPARYIKIADMWRDMARLVYGAARHQDTLSFAKAASIANRIADLEDGVLRDIEKVI